MAVVVAIVIFMGIVGGVPALFHHMVLQPFKASNNRVRLFGQYFGGLHTPLTKEEREVLQPWVNERLALLCTPKDEARLPDDAQHVQTR